MKMAGIWLAALFSVASISGVEGYARAETPEPVQESPSYIFDTDEDTYAAHYSEYRALPWGDTVTAGVEAITAVSQEDVIRTIDGKQGIYIGGDHKSTELTMQIPHTGRYAVNICYYTLPGSTRPIEFSIEVDGKQPYTELGSLTLPRIWRDRADEAGETIHQDSQGNERLPDTEEINRWNTLWLWDAQGLYEEPYCLYLTEGTHSLRLTAAHDEFVFGGVELGEPPTAETYEAYCMRYADRPDEAIDSRVWQAERYLEKNSAQIYSSSDRTDAATIPNDPTCKRINVIGGANWKYAGQEISWEIDVPASGLYELAFRYRQNTNQGMTSYRMLLIDGKLPFEEADSLAFDYALDWTVQSAGGNKPYRLYLEEGQHTVTLRVAPGAFSGILRDVRKVILDMTQLYRSIVMITGNEPDIYRDYSLEKQIPGLKGGLEDIAQRLEGILGEITSLTGTRGTMASGLDETLAFIRQLLQAMYQIPERVSRFSSCIEGMGSLLLQLSEQPLELDCLAIIPQGGERLRDKAGFWEQVFFDLQRYIMSYVLDYDSVGGSSGASSINVWVSSGRDQAQVLENMITDQFSQVSDTGVQLSLVNTGQVLIQAALAGKGPDVALMVANDLPVNLAMRGELVDLQQFGLDTANSTIHKEAWNPYRYNGGIYAVPETQVFDMLFYRTDIFSNLGIQPPESWEDFYEVLIILQQNNLKVAIPETDSSQPGISAGISTFDKFLYQSGGRYFNEGLSATRFEESAAVAAFERWCELYSRYSIPREVNFFNRFRTGEVAMGIQSYTMYSQLTAAAPEIKGLWAMAPVPGTRSEDGELNRRETSSGTAAIMLNACVEKGMGEKAFAFISWWTGSEAQAHYGNSLESIMGVAARYTPANTAAFEKLGWSGDESAVLQKQWEWVTAVEQIPGSYYITRALTSAFRMTVDEKLEARRQLLIFNKDINDEITRKRSEFGLHE